MPAREGVPYGNGAQRAKAVGIEAGVIKEGHAGRP